MVFSIVALAAFVAVVWGISYCVRTSDRRTELMEEQRERDYLRFSIRG